MELKIVAGDGDDDVDCSIWHIDLSDSLFDALSSIKLVS
jgi:hypothetical protein